MVTRPSREFRAENPRFSLRPDPLTNVQSLPSYVGEAGRRIAPRETPTRSIDAGATIALEVSE